MTDETRPSKAFDRLKRHRGTSYSGMKVGASHKWRYDEGEWRERKLTPDEWDIFYRTTKRRAGKAPEGSGAAVGTEYNWLIVTHQRVTKLDANNYLTCMEGRKYKVAHKRAGKEAWNASEPQQRREVTRYLEELLAQLKAAEPDAALEFTVDEGTRIYGLDHFNKTELGKLASELGVAKRSKLKREDLLAAVQAALEERDTLRAMEKAAEREATDARAAPHDRGASKTENGGGGGRQGRSRSPVRRAGAGEGRASSSKRAAASAPRLTAK